MKKIQKIVHYTLVLASVFYTFGTLALAQTTSTAYMPPQLSISSAQAGFVSSARDLRLGESGTDITALQTALATWPTIYPQALTTGYFGALTEQAVISFQQKYGLVPDGVVGPITLKKINDTLNGGVSGSLIISTITSTRLSTTSTEVDWTTSQPATTGIFYSTATPFSGLAKTLTVSDHDLFPGHGVDITGLTSGTTYYYVLASYNPTFGTTTSTVGSFKQ